MIITIIDFKPAGDFLWIRTRQGEDEPWFCIGISQKCLEKLNIFPGLVHEIDMDREDVAKDIKCIEKNIYWTVAE